MIFATIMAGGSGTRFWPASRKANPKQLLKLTGSQSMLQATVSRLQGLCPPDQVMVVTNQSLVEPIAVQLPDVPRGAIIGEPAKRDTAPCIALAASLALARDPEATMVVMPADHVIQPDTLFQQAIEQAVQLVEEDPGRIVTFGIQPSYPAEVFGYIERCDKSLDDVAFPVYPVSRFREKPDAETARRFLEQGTFYWNAGIFVWKAGTILNAVREYEPEIAKHIDAIAARIGKPDFEQVLQDEFTAIRGKSIDFAVMEHYPNVLVMQAPFDWDDLGNWTAIPRLRGTDQHGNTVAGKFLGIETRDSIIQNLSDRQHLIVTVGLQNCIVVETDNATLVADRDQEAAIKQVVQQLEDKQWDAFL